MALSLNRDEEGSGRIPLLTFKLQGQACGLHTLFSVRWSIRLGLKAFDVDRTVLVGLIFH